MDKILYIIIAAVVLTFAATTVSVLNFNTADSIGSFSDDASNIKCESQTENWEEGDHVSPDCLDDLSEDEQDEYTAVILQDDLT